MFGRTSASKRIVAVADVGSGSAAFAIVALHHDAPASIIASCRVPLPYGERTADAIGSGVIKCLAEASEKARAAFAASADAGMPITDAYAVIGAPWTRSVTARAVSKSDKDIRITDHMLADLARQAIASDTSLERTRVIESSVVRVELNGYPTGKPVGKSAHIISVIALLSDCDAAIRNGIEETFGRLIPGKKPVLRSGTRSLLGVLRAVSAEHSPSNCVVVEIEGEATTVLVVRGGIAGERVVIPEGMRSIITRLSHKGLPEETLSLVRMAEHDESSTGAADTIRTSIARIEPELARIYGEALTKLAIQERLPPDMLLVAHPDLLPWLGRFFARIDFTQCTVTMQPFSVQRLESTSLSALVVAESGVQPDIGISIAAALVNSELQS